MDTPDKCTICGADAITQTAFGLACKTHSKRIDVKLLGEDGNAFVIMGIVSKALKAANYPAEVVRMYVDQASEGDYGHLLTVTERWVDIV